jgi:hypothetical protein
MGFDNHAANFLYYSQKKQNFGQVATLGRQELHIHGKVAEFFSLTPASDGEYCEDFLRRHLGATKVDSIDMSDYENATHIADMNLPIEGFPEYDTVIDAGSLEHIYNIPQALKNVSQLCRQGGQIIHVSPANNECGHGFWQFCPELFYSLYSEKNGYADTIVFVASKDNRHYWYEVTRPNHGDRVYIQSLAPIMIMCRTLKIRETSHADIQQSDYTHVWNAKDAYGDGKVVYKPSQGAPHGKLITWGKQKIWSWVGELTPIVTFLRFINLVTLSKTAVCERNPYLTKRSIAQLLLHPSAE